MTPTLKEMETLARKAGAILLEGYGKKHQIDFKSEIDPVTETDRKSEEFLVSEIKLRYPDDRIVAEESGESQGINQRSWYIDPLDGTVNFSHDIPIFSVSIAFANHLGIQLGVVYDPIRDECFSAEYKKGAFLNDTPIHVSQIKSLNQSLLVTGFPYDIRSNHRNNLNYHNAFMLCSQGVRRLGSAALDLSYVAAGRFDGFWELSLEAWDVAAGILIAREAGALVTDVDGGDKYFLPPYPILAASPIIHAQMLDVIRNA